MATEEWIGVTIVTYSKKIYVYEKRRAIMYFSHGIA